MKITQLPITHSGPIYSIAVHYESHRTILATSGQDFHIQLHTPDGVHLSTLSGHTGAVLCVAFAPDGRLASGSDDRRVLVWKKMVGSAFMGLEGGSERWAVVRILVGHESDVSDVAWSNDGRYLASGSFDSKIFIWDAVSLSNFTLI